MRVGMIVAVEEEALLQKYGRGTDLGDKMGTALYHTDGVELYALRSGAGEIFAALATQYLIDRYEVAVVVNYGVVGACIEDVKAGEPCFVRSVVHYQYDISAVDGVQVGRYLEYPSVQIPVDQVLLTRAKRTCPSLRKLVCASGDRFVGEADEKIRLHEEFGADICDMEAAAILLTCNRNHVPCLLVKTVSDSVRGGASEYWSEKESAARSCLDIVDSIIKAL